MNSLKENLEKILIITSVLIPITVLTSAGSVCAATPAGAAFLKIDPSVRNYALGGSHVVLNRGCQALGSNPANLSLLQTQFEVMSTYSSVIADTHYGYLAGATEAWPGHFTAVSLAYLTTIGLEARDALGNYLNDFSAQDFVLGGSWSKEVIPKGRTGGTVKIFQSYLGEYNSNISLALDAGFRYDLQDVQLGLSINNLGFGLKFINETDPLPLSVNLGAAMPIGPTLSALSLHYLFHDQKFIVTAGAEYGFMEIFTVRAGYNFESGENLALQANNIFIQFIDGLSLGIGIAYQNYRLDYAIAQSAVEWGFSHRVAVALGW